MKYRIGFFDSGVGGISVLSHAVQVMGSADYIYYADTDNVPYGTKTREEVMKYSHAAISTLADRGVCAVVVACNTATSMAIEYLRSSFDIPIIGMEPAVKPAALAHPGQKVLVCATPLTINGKKLHDLVDANYEDHKPDLLATPKLVTYAENGIFDEDTVCEYLDSVIPAERDYAAVVLGCTHFGYFRHSFRKLLPESEIIDGTDGTVRRMISVLREKGITPEGENGSITFLQSGREVKDEKTLEFYRFLMERAR